MPVTVYGVATALMRAPSQLKAMQDAGWEIASHGLKWVEHKDMPPEVERGADRTRRSGSTPSRPASGRSAGTPAAARSTPSISSPRKAASPTSPTPTTTTCPTGGRTRGTPSSSSPTTLATNDMRFVTASGFANGEEYFQILKDTFDAL